MLSSTMASPIRGSIPRRSASARNWARITLCAFSDTLAPEASTTVEAPNVASFTMNTLSVEMLIRAPAEMALGSTNA